MRGTVYTFSRHPSARLLTVGTAILVGTMVSAAHGQLSGSRNCNGARPGDDAVTEVAALPPSHFEYNKAVGIVLPRPLNPVDATILRRIFTLQARGDTTVASQALTAVSGSLIFGTVLADQYL